MQISKKKNIFIRLAKAASFLLTMFGAFYVCQTLAAGNATGDLGDLAKGVTTSYSGIGSLMIGTAYLAGIGFSIAAIFKFKQHRDNPTQIPIGTPLALLVIGIVLVFLPGIIKPAGTSIFGTDAANAAGGFTGGGANKIPGGV